MSRLRGGSGFAVGVVAGLVAVQVVAAVTVTPLSFPPVAGGDFGVTNDDRLVYDGWSLVFTAGGDVTGVGVDLNNTESVDKTGVITFRLERKNGTVVASNTTNFSIQRDRAGRCSVSLASTQPRSEFSFVVLEVNVTSVATRDCEIKGGGSNKPPNAKFEVSPKKPTVGDTVTFDASKSNDNDGTIVAYDWVIEVENDTVTPSGQVVNHTYTEAGCYNATLTVTDDDGATDTANETVEVDPQGGNTRC